MPELSVCLTRDWDGLPVGSPLRCSLACEAGALVFRAARAMQPRLHPTARAGAFTPGLWEYDVAELFLAPEHRACYAELNLSPNGAWWGCVFTAPRQRAAHLELPEGCAAIGCVGDQGWSAELRVPWAGLRALGIEPERCRWAVAAVLRRADGTLRYQCSAPHGDTPPDFHHPDAWPLAALPS